MSAVWNEEVLDLLKKVANAVYRSPTGLTASVADIAASIDRHTASIDGHTASIDGHTASIDGHIASIADTTAKLESNTGSITQRLTIISCLLLVLFLILLILLFLIYQSLAAFAEQRPTQPSSQPATSASCWFCPTILSPVALPASGLQARCFKPDAPFEEGRYDWPPGQHAEQEIEWVEVEKPNGGGTLSEALTRATLIVAVGSHDSKPLRPQKGGNRLDSNFDLATRRANAVIEHLKNSEAPITAPVLPLALSLAPLQCAPKPEDQQDRRTPRLIIYHSTMEMDRHGQ
jgi:preprotein translocase subunit SecG